MNTAAPAAVPAFTFRLASGATVGPVVVHGFGGLPIDGADAEKRVRLAIAKATSYEDFAKAARISEPCPGQLEAHTWMRGFNVLVNLRGARLIAVTVAA